MPIIEAWKKVVLESYTKFDGRAGRAEYWWFVLASVIVYAVLLVLSAASSLFLVLYFLYALAILLPSIAVSVRRLHDTNKTGWLVLIGLIPFIGGIILLVFMVLEGDKQPNQFGPVPEGV